MKTVASIAEGLIDRGALSELPAAFFVVAAGLLIILVGCLGWLAHSHTVTRRRRALLLDLRNKRDHRQYLERSRLTQVVKGLQGDRWKKFINLPNGAARRKWLQKEGIYAEVFGSTSAPTEKQARQFDQSVSWHRLRIYRIEENRSIQKSMERRAKEDRAGASQWYIAQGYMKQPRFRRRAASAPGPKQGSSYYEEPSKKSKDYSRGSSSSNAALSTAIYGAGIFSAGSGGSSGGGSSFGDGGGSGGSW